MSEFTVAELLAAADRDARQLLGHTEPDDGPGLTAAWPELLRSAAVLLASAPQPRMPQTSDDLPALDGHVQDMLAEAKAAPPLQLPSPHDSCARIIDTWYQAAAQASRPAHSPTANDHTPNNPAKPADLVDPAALRTRVARTLATVAHVAGSELQAHTQRRQDVDARDPRPQWVMSKSNPPPKHAEVQWTRMLYRHEHHALDHIAAPSTEDRPEPSNQRFRGPGPTLPAEVATWSILARRQSTDPQSGARDLRRVALTQRAALYATASLAHTAVHRGEIPGEAGPHLQARINAAARSWAEVADQWSWAHLSRAREPTEASAEVSGRLFAAINTNLRSRNTWLSPGDVDDRFAGVPLVPMLRSILESNEILAEVYQHLPDQLRAEGRLFARVTALLRISKETALDPNGDPSRLPLITRNVLRDPLGRLTPAAHGRLHTTAAALVENAERAHHALLASAGTTAATPVSPATTPALLTVARHRPERPTSGTHRGPDIPR